MKKHFILLAFMACVFTGIYAKSPIPNSGSQTSIGNGHLFKRHRNGLECFAPGKLFEKPRRYSEHFLLGKGVELDNLVKTDKDVKEQADNF